MVGERFTVAGVTGYASLHPSGSMRYLTTWGVRDTAYCHRVVREFPPSRRGSSSLTSEQRARALAAQLNAEPDHEPEQREPDLLDALYRRAALGDRRQ